MEHDKVIDFYVMEVLVQIPFIFKVCYRRKLKNPYLITVLEFLNILFQRCKFIFGLRDKRTCIYI